MNDEGISIVELTEVNSNWSKIPTKDNIYNRMNRWFKTRRISKGFNQVTTSNRPFQSGGTAIMEFYEVSHRAIAIV